MIRQGPRTPDLLAYLKETERRFDAFVFFTYLYYPTYFGLPLVAAKSVLVPTLHDEPPARFDIFRPLFRLPKTFVWNTPEERDLARRMFGIEGEGEVAGIGIDLAAPTTEEKFRARHGLGEFVLYLGRLDVWKGIPELVDFFTGAASTPLTELLALRDSTDAGASDDAVRELLQSAFPLLERMLPGVSA